MSEACLERFIDRSLYARLIQIKSDVMRFRLRLVISTFVNLCYLKKNENDGEMFINYKEKKIIIERLLTEA